MSSIQPVGGLPPTVGLYSHAVPVPPGRTVIFIAGQLSVDAAGASVAEGDFEGQVRQVFDNLLSVVHSAGGAAGTIVKMTTYLVDPSYVELFYEERARIFADIYPDGMYPANTLLVINRLVRPEFLIEIEAVAMTGGNP
jgi:2-iminobutanoate/2-iminopropanoate deaminase